MYGLVPRAQEVSVYLNCRLRSIAPLLQFGEATKIGPFPRSFQRSFQRNFHHSARASEHRVTEGSNRPYHENEKLELEKKDSVQDHGLLPFIRRGTHRDQRHEQVSLGLQSLGEPVSIRIVNDKKRRDRQKADTSEIAITNGTVPSPEELLQEVATKGQGKRPFDYVGNIDHLHTTWRQELGAPGTPTARQCQSLWQSLHDGFTLDQLNHYVKEKSDRRRSTGANSLMSQIQYNNYRRSRWYYGTSTFPDISLERLRRPPYAISDETDNFLLAPGTPIENIKPTQSGKYAVVEGILRSIWQIRALEEMQGLGEIEFQVENPHRLEALLKLKTTELKKLSELYSVKINVYIPSRIIRFTGAYLMCLDTVSLLHKIINDIMLTIIDIPPKMVDQDAVLHESLLNEIEQSTGTDIQLARSSVSSHSTKVQIWHMNQNNKGRDDAHRLIEQALERPTHKYSKVLCYPFITDFTAKAAPITPGSSLPLHERALEWFRLVEGNTISETERKGRVTKKTSQIGFPPDVSLSWRKKIVNDVLQLWGQDKPQNSTMSMAPYWQHEMQRSLSATIGHVIHGSGTTSRTLPAFPKDFSSKELYVKLIRRRRNITTNIPYSLPTLNAFVSEPLTIQDYLHLTFYPNMPPEADSVASSPSASMPTLELRLAIDKPNRRISLASLHLICASQVSDLLLPTHGADIRFQAQARFAAQLHGPDPSIRAFIQASELDVFDRSSGNQLRPQPNLKLAVPLSALRLFPALLSGQENQDTQVTVLMNFKFVRLEYRSEMVTQWRGWRAEYTTVEGGMIRGSRSELRFSADTPETGEVEGKKKEWEEKKQWLMELLAGVEEVVQGIPR